MKNHRIQPISQRKSVEITPQAVAYAVAETMKGAVKSLITESMFPDLKDGSARYLYFGRMQPGGSQTEADSSVEMFCSPALMILFRRGDVRTLKMNLEGLGEERYLELKVAGDHIVAGVFWSEFNCCLCFCS